MVKPVWKLLSIFLALAVFIGTGAVLLCNGEELIWVVGKAVGSFAVCWIILVQLGNVLTFVVERQEIEYVESTTVSNEKGK